MSAPKEYPVDKVAPLAPAHPRALKHWADSLGKKPKRRARPLATPKK